ncbi:hypothetical protein RRG08_038016 [Elysia crispata]|uniref:Uncharacterized protein n=1 Tax=Elysia crispata TaxID=231223 RepID=A0AAE1DPS1_9GAST|nr:hypothetical protein RRG08_038016 [Elysia crispata]
MINKNSKNPLSLMAANSVVKIYVYKYRINLGQCPVATDNHLPESVADDALSTGNQRERPTGLAAARELMHVLPLLRRKMLSKGKLIYPHLTGISPACCLNAHD